MNLLTNFTNSMPLCEGTRKNYFH